ncbi:MAG: hypothetical protein B7X54_04900 [Idiomarina sp. 34-48-12]|nr:MAG: hypothetical protein B7X54_04900 [Idiomarina sp. 34-48-12]
MIAAGLIALFNHAVSATNLHDKALKVVTPTSGVAQQQCGVMAPVILYLPTSHDQQVLKNLARWHQHPLAQFVNCFSIQRYQPEQLRCDVTGTRQRASCVWHSANEEPLTRSILFVPAQRGLASSDVTQITLPTDASLSLFAHELGHWLGLADEYAMAPELANNFCLGRYDHASANVVITDALQMSSAELQQLWRQLPWHFAVDDWRQLGTAVNEDEWQLGSLADTVGLHAIATCDAVEGKYAWRPISDMTPMQYYDINQWPPLYLELIARP